MEWINKELKRRSKVVGTFHRGMSIETIISILIGINEDLIETCIMIIKQYSKKNIVGHGANFTKNYVCCSSCLSLHLFRFFLLLK